MEPIIQTEHLSHIYSAGTPFEHGALVDVDFTAYRGEYLGIIGHTGSGKSTLFLNLNGVCRPTGGQILYEGRPVDYSRKGLLELRRQVGIVFQDPDNQLFCASVAGEISFGLYNLGLDEEEIRRRVDAVCQKLSIDPFRDKPTHFLSGGQKKRVSIADILVMRPSLLILDEPFSALDPKHAQMIDEILSQLAREGITVVIATHNAAQAYRWADRVVILHNGCIQAQGTPEEIFCDQALLQRTSLVPPEILTISRALQQKKLLPDGSFPKTVESLCSMLLC